ncbi:MAG TPA: glycosyltransferase family 9 protein [Vicinamibacterales bacterium]|nr:glycosyltransferase family 9 protein [Vicinamibacterales bacterium]
MTGMPPAARILIVRLSALGDIVHALPVLAALRRQDPAVRVDWLVEQAYAPVLGLVEGVHRRVIVRAAAPARGSGPGREPPQGGAGGHAADVRFGGGLGYLRAAAFLRRQHYDAALDLQGLIKSAVWARLSGARRVIGFARSHLREPQAAWLYGETVVPPASPHVIQKNLSLATYLGASAAPVELPIAAPTDGAVARTIEAAIGPARYAVLNPGAAWPNKRWPPKRFGALAASLLHRHGLVSFVTWGPAERALAETIVSESNGAARLAPPTGIADLAALMGRAALVVSGDTGPLHIAAAMGAPIVGLYGPTWPERNGPWHPDDEVISRAERCQCHHKRQCLIGAPCINDISLGEVEEAVDRRLAKEPKAS